MNRIEQEVIGIREVLIGIEEEVIRIKKKEYIICVEETQALKGVEEQILVNTEEIHMPRQLRNQGR